MPALVSIHDPVAQRLAPCLPGSPALTNFIPHLGHFPGVDFMTSGCIGHVY